MTGEPAATMSIDWRTLLREAVERLRNAGVDDPASDARRIVEEASGHEGPAFHAGLDEAVTVRALGYFETMLARRERGEPLQYVLGRWGFRTLDLMVDPRVLIPRPETEQVAQLVHDLVDARLESEPDHAPIVVDLGTGSGAIALSIAAEHTGVRVIGTDVSPDSLAVARANLAGLGRRGAAVELYEGWWFEALPDDVRGRIDVCVSNPPYVALAEELPEEVASWEPPGALYAGPTGLEAAERIIAEAPAWLAPDGVLVLELGPHQLAAASELARSAGFADVSIHPDLAGRDRALVARLRP